MCNRMNIICPPPPPLLPSISLSLGLYLSFLVPWLISSLKVVLPFWIIHIHFIRQIIVNALSEYPLSILHL